ncbi:MAG: hypothetical protein N2255_03530 [Kiritimatiellae bacterium]|nr:hypothetical protein [Kiritimatiellia bacterium]
MKITGGSTGQGETSLDVRYHVLTDERTDLSRLGDTNFAVSTARRSQRAKLRRWFTSLCADPIGRRVYCGQTNRAGSVLHEFDANKARFRDLRYERVAEEHEMKIHRGLWFDPDEQALYFGLATLSPTEALLNAPGGRLMRYDILKRTYQPLGIPLAGNYIQATNYDPKRKLMYAFLEPSRSFAVWSVRRRELVRVHCVDSIVHVAALDDRGGVWGTCAARHRFFRYDPDADKFEIRDECVMPSARAGSNVIYEGAGPVDCMLNGGDGFLYVASSLGELYRLDPESFDLVYLGKPLPYNRLPGLCLGGDGMIYGVGGTDNQTSLFRYDRGSGRFEVLGRVAASDGTVCFRPHDLVMLNGAFFVAETDTPERSGYLWECRLCPSSGRA